MATKSLLPGTNTLLEGPSGTGKTHSIGTMVDYGKDLGLEVFVLALESGLESLLGYWTDRGAEVPTNLHWHKLDMADGASAFGALLAKADDIGRMTETSLFKVEDMARAQRNHFSKLIRQLMNFTCQRDGKQYGDVSHWGPNRALVIDGLTGLGVAAWSMVIGNKPTKSPGEWLRAQDNLEGLIRNLCDNSRCHFTLIAHVEREKDELTGGTKIMTSTLGNKLAPKLPPMFSDVILAQRLGTKFMWSTANEQVDLKTRNLPIRADLPPDFLQILQKWQSRGGAFLP